jgi:hypothetical protein
MGIAAPCGQAGCPGWGGGQHIHCSFSGEESQRGEGSNLFTAENAEKNFTTENTEFTEKTFY